MIKLSKRLQTIANFVDPGNSVADIGTDHALLSCYLIQEGIAPQVVAADVNEGPLKGAEMQVKGYLLQDKISLRLGNGLKVLKPGEIDTVVVAGMGGSTIKTILEDSPKVVKNLKQLILQPNIAGELIRRWACENNFKIVDEELINEDGYYYEIIVLEPGVMELKDDILFFLGPKLVEKKHNLLVPYLESIKESEQEILKQLAKSNSEKAKEKVAKIKNKWERIEKVIK